MEKKGTATYINKSLVLQTGFKPNYIMLSITGSYSDHTADSFLYLEYNTNTSKYNCSASTGDIYNNNTRWFQWSSLEISCTYSNNTFTIPVDLGEYTFSSCTWIATE